MYTRINAVSFVLVGKIEFIISFELFKSKKTGTFLSFLNSKVCIDPITIEIRLTQLLSRAHFSFGETHSCSPQRMKSAYNNRRSMHNPLLDNKSFNHCFFALRNDFQEILSSWKIFCMNVQLIHSGRSGYLLRSNHSSGNIQNACSR